MSWKFYDARGAQKTGGAAATSIPTQTVLSGSGTYTPPAGCTAILVECIGGGGGGGGTPTTAAGQYAMTGGGGGGAYAASLIQNPAASYAYAVGAGGAGGATGANPGTAGGDTSFGGGIVLAKGGAASAAGAVSTVTGFVAGAAGGAGGSSVGTEATISGENGGFAVCWAVVNANYLAGAGGDAARGGAGGVLVGTGGGVNGSSPGGGGSGSARPIASGTAAPGGNGANGTIIVTEYYGSLNQIGTFPQQVTAPAFIASGLTGATAASRYAGATASGAPTSGNWAVGDHVIDQSGAMWICITAGSPGTWYMAGAQNLIWDSADAGVNLTGVTSFSTPTLPLAFQHLVVHYQGSANAAGALLLAMQLNGDTGANYYGQRTTANNATVVSTVETAVTRMIVGLLGGTTNTSYRGSGVIFIPNYQGSSVVLPVTGLSSGFTGSGSSTFWTMLTSYMKGNTSATITSLTFLNTSAVTFLANSRFSVYGVTA